MSDPIADMDELINQLPWHAAYTEHKDGVWHCCFNREQLVEVENKMRQQIGRELLDAMKLKQLQMINSADFWDYGYKQVISEVCQLEEDNEKR